ncbi:hypothetical protein LWI28_022425 [Acer negundo]|uniref:Pectinesterase inhibitor domain-containing protein n=1 Tax=Acer negundo TaxID=4023 RepID=A0AAD5NJJ4_ACENE|nr:hypothetical protein LWI28_022425 [Acer negundo]KAK4838874.1 hypothetical protein QYF36_017213 [Acer negundo]
MEGSISKQFLIRLFLSLLAINSCINSSSATRPIASKTSTDFIKTSCSSTAYPTLCFASLASRATLIQTSPKLLAHAALNVTLSTAKSTSVVMLHLSKNPGTKPKEAEAMQDCLEELSDSVDELRRSIAEMGQIKSSNFQLTMSDIQTWVSAALTDDTTCSDGFNRKTKNGKVVRERILKIAHLTSNALALINSYASLHA